MLPPKQYAYKSLLIWDKKEYCDTLNKSLKECQKGELDLRFEKYNLKCTSNIGLICHDIPFS